MKIVTVGAMKGGAGKTMVTVNLAGCLAEKHRVLLIDVDPQANASSGLGIDIAVQDRLTIADILEDSSIDPEKVILRQPVKGLANLDLIPSTIWLTETELKLVARGGRERLLANYVEDNAPFFEQYDYVIIDTNPSMGTINQNAYFVADSIVLVTDVSNNGVQGVEVFTYLWDKLRKDLRKEDNVKALVINNLDKRIGLSQDLVEYCKSHDGLSPLLVEPCILSRVAFKETEIEATPINMLRKNSEEHKLILSLIDSLRKKEVL